MLRNGLKTRYDVYLPLKYMYCNLIALQCIQFTNMCEVNVEHGEKEQIGILNIFLSQNDHTHDIKIVTSLKSCDIFNSHEDLFLLQKIRLAKEHNFKIMNRNW